MLGQGMANLANTLARPSGRRSCAPETPSTTSSARSARRRAQLLPLLEPGLGHALRSHLRTVLRQAGGRRQRARSGRLPGTVDTTVAFADLTGFTRRARACPRTSSAALAEHFAELAERPRGAARCGWSRRSATRAMLVAPTPTPCSTCGGSTWSRRRAARAAPAAASHGRRRAAARRCSARGDCVRVSRSTSASRLTTFARRGTVVTVRERARGGAPTATGGRSPATRRFKGVARP